jgi:hypothetical protein
MRTDPRNTLRFHVIRKCAAKIKPVPVTSVCHIGLQHVRRAQSPCLQEVYKLVCQGDRARVPILRTKCFCRTNLDGPRCEIKPLRPGFHDFHFAHASVETAEQHKAQTIVGRVLYQPLCQFEIRKQRPRFSVNAIELHLKNGIATAKILLDAPTEERAEREYIALCCARGDTCLSCIVENFAVTAGDVRWWYVLHGVGKHI